MICSYQNSFCWLAKIPFFSLKHIQCFRVTLLIHTFCTQLVCGEGVFILSQFIKISGEKNGKNIANKSKQVFNDITTPIDLGYFDNPPILILIKQ